MKIELKFLCYRAWDVVTLYTSSWRTPFKVGTAVGLLGFAAILVSMGADASVVGDSFTSGLFFGGAFLAAGIAVLLFGRFQ